MTSHITLKKLIDRSAWMTKLDIKDAYVHVPVAPEFQKFLAFLFNGRLFFFRALPFGLSTAPYLFSKMVAYPISLLRERGIKILAYLDDLILWSLDKREMRGHFREAVSVFSNMGFTHPG